MSEVTGQAYFDSALGVSSNSSAVTSRTTDQHNIRLQYLRAVAAIAVVLYHASWYLKDLRDEMRFSAVFGDLFGAGGVAIFFALSGYLMAEIIRRDDWGRFLISRVARIYPPMLLMVALFAVVYLAYGQPRGLNVMSLTLVPMGSRDYFLAVEWTLLYEMTYYVALTGLGLLGLVRWSEAFALVWLVALGFAWIWGSGAVDIAKPTLTELPLLIINLPFVLGFLSAGLKRRGWLPPGLGIVAMVMAGVTPLVPVEVMRLLSGFAAALFVAATIRRPPPNSIGSTGSVIARFGDASYVLYLCHVPVLQLVEIALPNWVPAPLVWLGMVGTALGLSLLLGPLDVRLHRWLKRAINKAPDSRLRAYALSFIVVFLAIGSYAELEVREDRAEEAQAREILASAPTPASLSVRAEIDSVSELAGNRWVVRGYGIDLDRPALATHIAIRQAGNLLAIDRMRRMRVATARNLGRSDLERRRFGFSLFLPTDLSCARGALDAVFIFEDGRAVPIAPGQLATICR
jgi:peptidoglycan/LPS O-acetylase OafA/YrhL